MPNKAKKYFKFREQFTSQCRILGIYNKENKFLCVISALLLKCQRSVEMRLDLIREFQEPYVIYETLPLKERDDINSHVCMI